MPFPLIVFHPSFQHDSEQVTVGTDVVEPVIMHPGMTDMRGHELKGMHPAQSKNFSIASGIELQDLRSVLKPLCPFRPPTGGIFSTHRKNR